MAKGSVVAKNFEVATDLIMIKEFVVSRELWMAKGFARKFAKQF